MIHLSDGESRDGVDLRTDLFLSIAKVQELYQDADVTVTCEYFDDEKGLDIFHVITDGHMAISGAIGEGYEVRDYRYVMTEQGDLLGVERYVPLSMPEDSEWVGIKIDPETWEEIES